MQTEGDAAAHLLTHEPGQSLHCGQKTSRRVRVKADEHRRHALAQIVGHRPLKIGTLGSSEVASYDPMGVQIDESWRQDAALPIDAFGAEPTSGALR